LLDSTFICSGRKTSTGGGGAALFRNSGNLLLAQKLLRYESVATTQVYLHPNQDDLARALEALDDGEDGF
jgi:hypothetical protein